MNYTVSAKKEFVERLRKEADKTGMTISEYIRYCITRHWEQSQKRGD